MEWHKMKDISRVHEIIKAPKKNGNFSNRMYQSIFSFVIFPITIYQHGVRLINEKGKTKDVWEEIYDANEVVTE